ncbi:amidase [Acinetobacter puyangensis]|uniref:Amidase n=1 Tax=Acinetobacter puyangensis TaxID=1096779 RepID=A0A240E9H1_9GAMM|nr:amidase [Acinetobacter puyangensis]SNX44859.1 amidase [Acinetobacter puyangensis]
MNRREFLKKSTLGLVALSALPSIAKAIGTGNIQLNNYNINDVANDPNDPLGAFMNYGKIHLKTTNKGPLHGKTFAIKDNFHLIGYPTGAGNPDWLKTHGIEKSSAPVVNLLLAAGATLVGKTHMDELAWSLMGKNAQYGIPINKNAPNRIPGGSSSGSASAVSGKVVDFALGTDTGGSIRVPASFSGLFGLRPTHGRISLEGVVPLAPSFDTVGWFSRDTTTFETVGHVLFGVERTVKPKKILLADDIWKAAGADVSGAVQYGLDTLQKKLNIPIEHIELGKNDDLKQWGKAFSTIQSSEIWRELGSWVEQNNPQFGPGISDRFKAAKQVKTEQVIEAQKLRLNVTKKLSSLLANGTILIYPTVPGIAPRIDTSEADLNTFRAKMLEMLCPAGFAGLPQMNLPVGILDNCPVGLSVVGAQNTDSQLLALSHLVEVRGQKN